MTHKEDAPRSHASWLESARAVGSTLSSRGCSTSCVRRSLGTDRDARVTQEVGRVVEAIRNPSKSASSGSFEGRAKSLERVKGIEPSSVAWEATALPLSYTRCAARHLLYGFGNSAAISTRHGSDATRFRRAGNGLRNRLRWKATIQLGCAAQCWLHEFRPAAGGVLPTEASKVRDRRISPGKPFRIIIPQSLLSDGIG